MVEYFVVDLAAIGVKNWRERLHELAPEEQQKRIETYDRVCEELRSWFKVEVRKYMLEKLKNG